MKEFGRLLHLIYKKKRIIIVFDILEYEIENESLINKKDGQTNGQNHVLKKHMLCVKKIIYKKILNIHI
jgi:hypothetical protein